MQPASTPEQHACMELTRTQRSTGTGSAELAWASPLLFRPSAVAQDLVCEAAPECPQVINVIPQSVA